VSENSGAARPVRTLFLGSGHFAVPIGGALLGQPLVTVIAVVTAPARPGAADTPDVPVAEWAVRRGLPLLRPLRLRDPATIEQLRALAPGLIVLADYGQMVPNEVLALPRYGALNVHPSLLPRYRGASPIAATIMAGDSETGVSIIRMDAGLDSGPIVAQQGVALSGSETAVDLETYLAALGGELLASSLEPWLAGAIVPVAQPAEGMTMTHALRREDGRVDPMRGVEYLERQVRAYQPWPGTFMDTPVGRIIIWEAQSMGSFATRRPGTLLSLPAGRLGLATCDGMLELIEVQPAGGRRMNGGELLRGRQGLAGTVIAGPPETDIGA
jgi:methionyl-tRNA formyltransferase